MKTMLLTAAAFTVVAAAGCAHNGPHSHDQTDQSGGRSQGAAGAGAAETNAAIPAYFIEDALAAPIVIEERTLADGTTTPCYVIRTYSEPLEHEMGPWAPTHIEDGADKGGIWFHDGHVHDVDGAFVRDIDELSVVFLEP